MGKEELMDSYAQRSNDANVSLSIIEEELRSTLLRLTLLDAQLPPVREGEHQPLSRGHGLSAYTVLIHLPTAVNRLYVDVNGGYPSIFILC